MKRRTFIKTTWLLAACALASCRRRGSKAEAPAETAPAAAAAAPAAEKGYGPGDVVPEEYLASHPLEDFFKAGPIPDGIFTLMKDKTYQAGCTIPREDLRYILCLHKDIEGRTLVGEMVVSKIVADRLVDIFLKLYEASYPIEKMRLPDYWNADDEMMMRDNNSSCFNYRAIPGATKLSTHSQGVAVDINPLYNPYVRTRKDGTTTIRPATGAAYADRSADFDYKVKEGDLCHRLFLENGFRWGGSWRSVKDYQHFELAGAE